MTTTLTGTEIVVRRVALGPISEMDPRWNPRAPEFAVVANAVSLLLPDIEPYLVRSVRAVLTQVSPALAVVAEDFAAQEAEHLRQHREFNSAIRRGYPAVARVERWISRAYGWLSRTRTDEFNVAFAAGSEAIAYSIARWTHDHYAEVMAGADPEVAQLFMWHLAEEVEHKSVAFDVERAVNSSRALYLGATLTSVALVGLLTVAGAVTMLWSDRRLLRPLAWIRLTRWAVSFFFHLAPALAASALPGHHPDQLVDPALFGTVLRGVPLRR